MAVPMNCAFRCLTIALTLSSISVESASLTDKTDSDISVDLQMTVGNLIKEVESLKSSNARLERSMAEDKLARRTRFVMTEAPVAFYTQLTQDLGHIGQKQTIIFNNVVTNLGSGYNHFTGMFTAPSPGTYVFTWTVQNYDHTHMRSELVLNNEIKGMAWADAYDHRDIESASNTAVLQLSGGDAVWVRANYAGTAPVSQQGSMLSSFSGWLLYDN